MSESTVRIAVDCMGGDFGVAVIVPACEAFALANPDTVIILVGRESDIRAAGSSTFAAQVFVSSEIANAPSSVPSTRLLIAPASEVVGMDESPALAMRNKKDSSIRVGAELIKAGSAHALVSAGNTGALMAISRYVLKMIQGIERPAIAGQLPNQKGGVTTMLDLGANVDCTPDHLLQFANMGAALVSALGGPAQPSVGLLNIGEELIKGNEIVKQTAELLRSSALNFYGNVEGDDIYKGTVDVIVCDGFVGNVALKTSEGLAQMMTSFIREEFSRGVGTKLAAVLSTSVLKRFKARVDHRHYNGAALIGLRGIVIKSHGSSDSIGFQSALRRAHDAAKNRLVDRIAALISKTVV
jgi:phosphate acyltransferase